jgi:uncharacterized RDD family membrane protein YckC
VRHLVEVANMVWYYVKDGARQGPVEEAELLQLVGQSVVKPDTLVWCDGMANWSAYSTVAPAPAPPPAAPPEPAAIVTPDAAPAPSAERPSTQAYGQSPDPSPDQAYAQAYAQLQAEAPVPAGNVAAAASPMLYCTQCGKPYPGEEMVRFGAAAVCANCKDIYAQRIRETGHVSGAREYAGFWIRFVAVFIDGIALWIVNIAIQSVTGTMRMATTQNFRLAMGAFGINFAISMTISLLYESFFLVQYGATPGKMILKLKVITPEGGGITWGRAIGRFFAKRLSDITLTIGYIMAGFDSEKRALHDYVAGTRVIKTN